KRFSQNHFLSPSNPLSNGKKIIPPSGNISFTLISHF
ncbi:MAG: hypothetical protein ACI9JY_001777, partial [Saprospiraceae bacterium]